MKKYISSLLLIFPLILGFSSCEPNSAEMSLFDVLAGNWKVVSARYGTEEAPLDMYDGFLLSFTKAGRYSVTNPKGAVSITRNPSGTYTVQGNSQMLLDGAVQARVLSGLSRTRVIIELDVTVPGKATTTYRFELVPA